MKAKYSLLPLTNGDAKLSPLHRVLATPLFSPTFLTIVRSALPQLLFLSIYGLNLRFHLLPKLSDLGCVHLYNVSAVEEALLHTAPHRLVSSASNGVFDVFSAIPYLLHYLIPVVYPLFLYFRGQTDDISRFYWLLGWASWTLFAIWFLLPTAPPWLYESGYGAYIRGTNSSVLTGELLTSLHKEGCAFSRLDAWTGMSFFYNMFKNNPVPFASFPSGHVVWPTCIYVTSPPGGRVFALYVLWMTWATLYSCHHYLSDALAAVVVVLVVKRLLTHFENRSARTRPLDCSVVCPFAMV